MENYDNKCREIYNNYGKREQLKHFHSEVYELVEALLCEYTLNHITEDLERASCR